MRPGRLRRPIFPSVAALLALATSPVATFEFLKEKPEAHDRQLTLIGAGLRGRLSYAAPTTYCFTLVMPFGNEKELILEQKRLNIGIFTCDEYVFVSNVSSQQLFNMELPVLIVNMPLAAPRGGARTRIWIRVWDVIFAAGQYAKYDWTLKLDADTVVNPYRLRKMLLLHSVVDHNGTKPVLVETMGGDLHGAVEAINQPAMKKYQDGASRCEHTIDYMTGGITDIRGKGEDFYLDLCLKSLQVNGVGAMYMLDEETRIEECSFNKHAVLHSFKQPKNLSACATTAGAVGAAKPQRVQVDSLLCFTMVMPGTPEVALLKEQQKHCQGIFSCESHVVFSVVSFEALFGKHAQYIKTVVVASKTDVWDVVVRDRRYVGFDYSVYLEPAVVLNTPRLREWLWNQCMDGGDCGPVFFNSSNGTNTLHSPVEIFSEAALNQCRNISTATTGLSRFARFGRLGRFNFRSCAAEHARVVQNDTEDPLLARCLNGVPADCCWQQNPAYASFSLWTNHSDCLLWCPECVQKCSGGADPRDPVTVATVTNWHTWFGTPEPATSWLVVRGLMTRWVPLQVFAVVMAFFAVATIAGKRQHCHAPESPTAAEVENIETKPMLQEPSQDSAGEECEELLRSTASMQPLMPVPPAPAELSPEQERTLLPDQTRLKRRQVLWTMRLTGLGMQMNAMSLVPIAHKIAQKAGAGLTASGLLLGTHYLGGALGLAVFYYLSKRTVRGAMILHTTLMTIGSLLCITGQTWYPSLTLVYISRVITGAEMGISLITNVVTVQMSSAENKARNIMLNDIGCAVGSCFGPLLTVLVPSLPNPLGVTLEAQVTVIIMCYGLCLLLVALAMVPHQDELKQLYQASSQSPQRAPAGGGAPILHTSAPEPRAGLLIGACLAVGAMDGMIYRCNMADLVLVVPAEYGLSTRTTAGVLGCSHWFRVGSMMLAARWLGKGASESMVVRLTVLQIIFGILFFRMSFLGGSFFVAVGVVLVFQTIGVMGAVKANVLKSLFTGHKQYDNADVIMANSVLSMFGSFAAPVVDRSIAEIHISQNVMPWYGIMSRLLQLAVWPLARLSLQHVDSPKE